MSDAAEGLQRADLHALVAELVRTPSVNPAFGGEGEAAIATLVERRLTAGGLEVRRYEAVAGRPSVVGRLRGTGGGPTLMLYAHLDTVGTDDMPAPFEPRIDDGRLYGRGAYDMKGALAACIVALERLAASGPLAGDVVLAAVADEEAESDGITEVLRDLRADGAIVTEPTGLQLCTAHKGFCWIDIETVGRAAHGSRPEDGIDANLAMGAVLHALAGLERELRARSPRPVLGTPSLHVGELSGGSGASTYAARCRARVERRTLPGESDEQVLAEIDAVLEAARRERPGLDVGRRLALSRPPFTAVQGSAVERAVDGAMETEIGAPLRRTGAAFWLDAALIAEAGIPTVVIGPDGGGAHAAEEWVDLRSLDRLTRILVRAAHLFCTTPQAGAPA